MDTSLDALLTQEAREFLDSLHRAFNLDRLKLLWQREQKLLQRKPLDFRGDTAWMREDSSWQVAPIPPRLEKRWVEITGPADSKMIINALNSGADVFMADFEDSMSPTWPNIWQGQHYLKEAVRKTLTYLSPEGKTYALQEKLAALFVRPRGWHLDEAHYKVDGEPISGSLFDFALYFFHNIQELLKQGRGVDLYLPKLECCEEARLWRDVFAFSEKLLKVPQGSIRVTVLIETWPAAFEMEEILYSLKEYIMGLNAGRWDYIFSVIKTEFYDRSLIFPDRKQITMKTPFMKAYTELLVATCHKRGAHAMGGMSAFVPSGKDKEWNEKAFEEVREDKLREVKAGFDGTWVAHPALVPIARGVFEEQLKDRPHQKKAERQSLPSSAAALSSFQIEGGKITKEGLRQNIKVALIYLEAWFRGVGSLAIDHLMEDAATAEIARSLLWQWLHHQAFISETGEPIDRSLMEKEINEIHHTLPTSTTSEKARKALAQLVLSEEFIPFLTLEFYKELI